MSFDLRYGVGSSNFLSRCSPSFHPSRWQVSVRSSRWSIATEWFLISGLYFSGLRTGVTRPTFSDRLSSGLLSRILTWSFSVTACRKSQEKLHQLLAHSTCSNMEFPLNCSHSRLDCAGSLSCQSAEHSLSQSSRNLRELYVQQTSILPTGCRAQQPFLYRRMLY